MFMISRGRFIIVLLIIIIRRQLVIKLNEALAPGHMSTLVLNKAFPIFMCGVINVDLVVLLMNYTINADTSIPWWIGWPLITPSHVGQACPSATLLVDHC
jgi:hypothetical protein